MPGHKGRLGNESAEYLAKLCKQMKPPTLHEHYISPNKING